jgi:Aldehyde dehydrogenase family
VAPTRASQRNRGRWRFVGINAPSIRNVTKPRHQGCGPSADGAGAAQFERPAPTAIANSTTYGLAGYVQGGDMIASATSESLRASRIYLNGAPPDRSVPGGDEKSGNGREYGIFRSEEYLDVKAVLGYRSA